MLKIFLPAFLLIAIVANAQKLPNTQPTGLRASTKVKADGKPTEWGDTFQALNRATEIFYTVANDNDNLYLVVQATDALVIRKIIAGGITLTISTSAKTQNSSESVIITYPVFEKNNAPNINLRNKLIIDNSVASLKMVDSFMNAANKELAYKSKQIKISGIKAIDDTAISVYNNDKIKAAALFNNKIAYTYELALPIKYIKPLIKQDIIYYGIRLNGSTHAEGAIIEEIVGGTRIVSDSKNMPSMGDMRFISSPTYLIGEYKLMN